MCFLKDMVLQKQPYMRLFLQYTLFGQLLAQLQISEAYFF